MAGDAGTGAVTPARSFRLEEGLKSGSRPAVLRGVSSQPTDRRTLELPPDLIVHEPELLRQELLEALQGGGQVTIDASEVHRVGIVALQLLLSFVREARKKGAIVEISGIGPELGEALRATGLARNPEFSSAGRG